MSALRIFPSLGICLPFSKQFLLWYFFIQAITFITYYMNSGDNKRIKDNPEQKLKNEPSQKQQWCCCCAVKPNLPSWHIILYRMIWVCIQIIICCECDASCSLWTPLNPHERAHVRSLCKVNASKLNLQTECDNGYWILFWLQMPQHLNLSRGFKTSTWVFDSLVIKSTLYTFAKSNWTFDAIIYKQLFTPNIRYFMQLLRTSISLSQTVEEYLFRELFGISYLKFISILKLISFLLLLSIFYVQISERKYCEDWWFASATNSGLVKHVRFDIWAIMTIC